MNKNKIEHVRYLSLQVTNIRTTLIRKSYQYAWMGGRMEKSALVVASSFSIIAIVFFLFFFSDQWIFIYLFGFVHI